MKGQTSVTVHVENKDYCIMQFDCHHVQGAAILSSQSR